MTNERLSNRYGKSKAKARNQRIFWTSIAGFLAASFFVWSIFINFGSPANLSGTIQNFDVVSPQQTKITLNIANTAEKNGVCAIKILNATFFVVGYKEIAIPGNVGKAATLNESINTTNIGVSASVDRCWLK